jgi:hypothetical protein
MMLGGTFNCDESLSYLTNFGIDEEDVVTIKQVSYISLKNGYRQDVLTCPDACEDTDPAVCRCTCNLDPLTADLTDLASAAAVLLYPYDVSSMTETNMRGAVAHYCANVTVYVGDHLEAFSPYDISFWPMHPTLERIFHAKMISRTFVDMVWVDNGTYTTIFGDTCRGE